MSELLSITRADTGNSAEQQIELGQHGEALASRYLEAQGYRLVMSNFKAPIGRNTRGVQISGEIDIVALEGETLCFIEVKTRRSDRFTPIITNVDLRKQRQIIRTAKVYRRTFRVWNLPHRYDVVTVHLPHGGKPDIELTRAFWNDSKFRKRSWTSPASQEY